MTRQPSPARLPAMTGPSGLTDREREAWSAFYALRRQLDRAIDVHLQEASSISSSEFEVLVTLSSVPDRRLRTGEIAARMGWEKSRVSHLTARMTGRGFLERTVCPADARGTWVELTPAGHRVAIRALRGYTALARRLVFDVLDETEVDQLAALSHKVLAAVAEDTADPCLPAGSEAEAG